MDRYNDIVHISTPIKNIMERLAMQQAPSDIAVRSHLNATYSQRKDECLSLDELAEAYINGVGSNVYKRFSFYAWELIMAGHTKIGAKAIAERIRWDNLIRKPDGEEFLVNNSYVAYMARKFMRDNPGVGGVFETRGKDNG